MKLSRMAAILVRAQRKAIRADLDLLATIMTRRGKHMILLSLDEDREDTTVPPPVA